MSLCQAPTSPSTDIGCKKPLFEFTDAILGDKLAEIREYALTKLGCDNSSAHFIHRTKNIAFVVISNNNVFSLEQNFFVQHDGYNDFSGGIKREYTKIQDSDLQYLFKSSILAFKEYYNLPDNAMILLQVQTSSMAPEDLPEDLHEMSITGQGIHTDGANLAALLCIDRQNVKGALNTFHRNLHGSQPMCKPTVLEPGKVAYFKDNSLYHHVSKAVPDDPSSSMTRSILLMHYPAEMYLVGAKNDSNDKGTHVSAVKMRASCGLHNDG